MFALIGFVSVGSQAWAGDWTPFLKGMKDDCQIHDMSAGNSKPSIPANLKKDVVANKFANGKADITLKNATAFGKPITRIQTQLPDSSDVAYVKVYFKDGDFSKIRSQFFVSLNSKKYSANKYGAWSMAYNPNADNMVVSSITEAKFKQLEQRAIANDGDYGSGVTGVLQVNSSGWQMSEADAMEGVMRKSLTFNSQNKTIECKVNF